MVMSNPPHPGHSIRENCLYPLGLKRDRSGQGSGCRSSHPLSGSERPRGYLPGDGHSSREGGLVQCRVLAAPAEHLGSPPSAQGRRPNQRRAIPAGVVAREKVGDVVELLEKL